MLHSRVALALTRALPQQPRLRVGIILAERFTLSAFATLVDHLRHAADEGDRSRQLRVTWSIVAARKEPVTASCGAKSSAHQHTTASGIAGLCDGGGRSPARRRSRPVRFCYSINLRVPGMLSLTLRWQNVLIGLAYVALCFFGAKSDAKADCRSHRHGTRHLGSAARAALPPSFRRGASRSLSTDAHALRALVDREYEPPGHRDSHRGGIQ